MICRRRWEISAGYPSRSPCVCVCRVTQIGDSRSPGAGSLSPRRQCPQGRDVLPEAVVPGGVGVRRLPEQVEGVDHRVRVGKWIWMFGIRTAALPPLRDLGRGLNPAQPGESSAMVDLDVDFASFLLGVIRARTSSTFRSAISLSRGNASRGALVPDGNPVEVGTCGIAAHLIHSIKRPCPNPCLSGISTHIRCRHV